MTNYKDYLAKQLQDDEFRAEYEALAPQYEITKQLIRLRNEQNLTQGELAERIGMKQSNISRLESGNYNPSVEVLAKIAVGLGKELHVEFRDRKPVKV